MKTLGERIRELREQKDLSLRELGARLGGVSAAFLSDVELGRRYPSEPVLAKMAKVLGTALDDLKSRDTRPTGEQLKRLASTDPAWGLAFRSLLEEGMTPADLQKLVSEKRRKPKEAD